ncbi:MAG: helix-turn-helix domain-containing protein [Oscillospiraceae bacterium]|nr:helix-turn-helix domain-containing protein [Oscillospiraceae bacterium]
MNSNLLGEQIAKFRKELGMTQEDLSKAVSISAQAVSRWECGGAPDVALLPGLADALGVTIDALFGREGGEKINIEDAAGRWLQGLPSKKRMEQLCRLIWSNVRYFLPDGLNMPEIGYLDTCQPVLDGSGDRLMISQCQGGGGILVDIHAEDLSFVTLWPKPENGYAQWLAPKSEYRRLFEILAKPGCLELLGYLHSREFRYFSPAAAAKRLHLSRETVEELLDMLVERGILHAMELELEEGEVTAYQVAEPLTFIPFLYLARCFMQCDLNHLRIGDQDPPLGQNETWKDGKEKK